MGTKSFYGIGQGSFYGGDTYGNGQLPISFIEKTVGPASIVSFNDGLKNKPLKECIVDIDPVQDLHRYSNPWPAGGGKNIGKFLNQILDNDRTQNGITFHALSENQVRISGTATGPAYLTNAATYEQLVQEKRFYKAGTYTLSSNLPHKTNSYVYMIGFEADGTQISGSIVAGVYAGHSASFTMETDFYANIQMVVVSGEDFTTPVNVWVQLESGSTATAWTPYSNICPITGHMATKVIKSGKNLFQKPYDITKPAMFSTDWQGTSIDGDWIVQTGHSVGIDGFGGAVTHGLKKGTYTFSFDVDATNAVNGQYSVTVWMIDIFGTIITSRIGNNLTNNYFYHTIKFNEDIDAFAVRVTSSGSSDTAVVKYKNIQLELGSTVTSYEPYVGQTYNIEFPLLSKNLADMQEENIKLGYYIATNGAETAHSSNFIYNQYIPVKANTSYTISMSSSVYFISISEYSSADRNGFIIRKAGGTGNNTKLTITTGDSTKYIRFGSNVRGSSGDDLTMQEVLSIDWMLEEGSTASDYEPYTSTVYGGSLDAVTGVLTVDRVMWTKNTSTMDNTEEYPGWRNSGLRQYVGGGLNSIITGAFGNIGETLAINSMSTNDTALLLKTQYNKTQTEWIALAQDVQFVVPLATPLTYQLTPTEVSTLLGTNNIWADTGDTTVKYLAKK